MDDVFGQLEAATTVSVDGTGAEKNNRMMALQQNIDTQRVANRELMSSILEGIVMWPGVESRLVLDPSS